MICTSLLANTPLPSPIKVCIPCFNDGVSRVEECQNVHVFLSAPQLFYFLCLPVCISFTPPPSTHLYLNFVCSIQQSALYRAVSVTPQQMSGGRPAGHFRAQRAASLYSPPAFSQNSVPGPTEALSQTGQKDTWPNHRNTSSCRLPDVHQGENSGQRWRSSRKTCSAALDGFPESYSLFMIFILISVEPGICTNTNGFVFKLWGNCAEFHAVKFFLC